MFNMDIDSIVKEAEQDKQNINSLEALEGFRLKYLGRKGVVAHLTGNISAIPPSERASFGGKVNELKNQIINIIKKKEGVFAKGSDETGLVEHVDLGLPGVAQDLGHIHPITKVMDESCDIFRSMGFLIVEGPEVETEFNNFTGLNIPLEHPSRDAFDTFYLRHASGLNAERKTQSAQRLLLRSHTSPVQIRVMKSRKPPLAIVVPGKVYRPDATDASHASMFHQIEGFMVDKDIRFSDLKGVLEMFAKGIFGEDVNLRFRPHFFPFTEPSAEVDISCILCRREQRTEEQRRCSVCGGKGWLEILGAGMIHPNVFKNVGYDPKKYTGFAFGMGVDRIAMLKYRINDIRLFLENDLRFLEQF